MLYIWLGVIKDITQNKILPFLKDCILFFKLLICCTKEQER